MARLARADCVCIGQELWPNELFSLVGLRKAVWGDNNKQTAEQRWESNP